MTRNLFSVIVLLVALAPTAAFAQYMYLDSNGDGVHTSADVLNGVGATQIEIWLRTDHKRDGSVAVCAQDPAAAMTINSSTVVLRSTNGTINWSNPVSLQPQMSIPYVITGSPTEFHIAYYGSTILPPGTYRLSRVTASVVSGTPSVDIVPEATTLGAFYYFTSFGCACPAKDLDNTMKLGSDWFDTDGLPHSTGGSSNVPPAIPAIASMDVTVGEVASANILISDSDGDRISLSLASGPAFVYVTELNSVDGSVTGRIYVRPRRGDEGEYDAVLAASDGNDQSQRSFHVSISAGPNHSPVAARSQRLDVVAATIAKRMLTAADADGDPLTFTKVSGPPFAKVETAQPGHGGGTGMLLLRPSLCDVGAANVIVGISDGRATITLDVPIRVLAPTPVSNADRSLTTSDNVSVVATADFNEDGHADAVTAGELRASLLVFLGDGAGNLVPHGSLLPASSSFAVAAGDWNLDGHSDIAVGALTTGSLRILNGRGDGTFSNPVEIPGIGFSSGLGVADFNGDGVDDLAVTGEVGSVAILLGHSGTGLEAAGFILMPHPTKRVVVGDYDLDGTQDLAISSFERSSSLIVLFGRGDGTFGDRRDFASSSGYYQIAAGDWNSDGALDLATVEFYGNGAHVRLGDGTGNFAPPLVSPTYLGTFGMVTTDWNADGIPDLLATSDGPTQLLLGRGDGTFHGSSLGTYTTQGLAIADLNEDGRPDLLGSSGGPKLIVLLNTTSSPTGVVARGFTSDAKVIPVRSSSRTLCARLEPMNGTFTALDVNGSTLRMTSEGTGSVSSVAGSSGKNPVEGDTDHNGISECPACFAMSDVARLFDGLQGKQQVAVRLEGSLLDGRRFCAPLSMSIIAGGGGALAARVEPNPMNPRGMLRFVLGSQAAVTVRLFDPSGRLVRTIWNRRPTEPGEVEAPIDGRNAAGQPMGTGIYFFQIEAGGEQSTGRFTILK